MVSLKGSTSSFPGCCGASVVHGLSTYVEGNNPDYAATLQFATTSSENGADTLKALKEAKFKRILTWRNDNGGRTCTLWVRGPAKMVAEVKLLRRKKSTVEDE